MPKWELNEALTLIRQIQPICKINGYHCGLIGGVLNLGESDNDLDIIILKLGGEKNNFGGLFVNLQQFLKSDIDLLTAVKYEDTARLMYRTIYNDKQVDLMVML